MNLTSNRSLTAVESQLLLDLNRRVALDLPWPEYQRFVRRGIALRLVEERQPPADEPRLYTPEWARAAAAGMGATAAESIRQSGVRVLGDLDALGRIASTGEQVDIDERPTIPTDVAVAALAAVIAIASAPVMEAKPPSTTTTGGIWSRTKAAVRRLTRTRRAS
jgi:hypothetical protein